MLLQKSGIVPLWAAVFGIALLWSSGCWSEGIFRCVDDAGRVEFRQTPCQPGKGESVVVNPQTVPWAKVESSRASKAGASGKRVRPKRSSGTGSGEVSEKQCWKKSQQLEKVQWQLRKGYKPSRGEKLRQRRRELEAFQRKFCR